MRRLCFLREFSATGFTAFAADIRHVLTVAADGFATLAIDHRHVLTIARDGFAAFAADGSHVLAIARDRFAAFAAGLPSFFGREFVRRAFFVGSAAAF